MVEDLSDHIDYDKPKIDEMMVDCKDAAMARN